jgi:mitogen-activated protein kinase organizer 1
MKSSFDRSLQIKNSLEFNARVGALRPRCAPFRALGLPPGPRGRGPLRRFQRFGGLRAHGGHGELDFDFLLQSNEQLFLDLDLFVSLTFSLLLLLLLLPPSPTPPPTNKQDRTIRLWNPQRNLLVKSYSGGHAAASKDDGVRCLAASADSARLASGGGSGDRGVAWWDVATGAVIRKWRGHDAAVGGVCLFDSSSGGKANNSEESGSMTTSVVVSASDDATARAWDPRSRSPNPIQVFRGAKDSLTGVGIASVLSAGGGGAGSNENTNAPSSSSSSSHPLVVTASVDGRMRSYDLRRGQQSIDDVGAPIAAMALGSTSCAGRSDSGSLKNSKINNSNDCALLAGLDGRLRLLDLRSGARLAEFSGHDASSGVRTGCALFGHASSLYAACGSEDGRVCCWGVEEDEGGMVSSVSIHGSSSSSNPSSGPVTAMAIRPGDAGMLLAAGTDGRVRVFQRRKQS